MPDYSFYCNNQNCKNNNKIVTLSLRMSEYDSADKTCKECGQPLSRTIESLVCGYIDNPDFYGKTSN